jgi:hypothetical protein
VSTIFAALVLFWVLFVLVKVVNSELRMAISNVTFDAMRGLFVYANRRVKEKIVDGHLRRVAWGVRPEHRPSQGPKNIQSDQGLLVTLTSFFYALFTYLPLRPSSNIMLIPWIVKDESSLAVLLA